MASLPYVYGSRAIVDLPERGRRQGDNPVQALAVRREPSPGVSVAESATTSSEAIAAKLGQGCLMQILRRSEDSFGDSLEDNR